MAGWEISARIRASLSKRSSSKLSARSTLTATRSPVSRLSASYTRPIPPEPASRAPSKRWARPPPSAARGFGGHGPILSDRRGYMHPMRDVLTAMSSYHRVVTG